MGFEVYLRVALAQVCNRRSRFPHAENTVEQASFRDAELLRAERRREQEFQRIDIEEHEEQQCTIESNRPRVLEPIAPEKTVVHVPDVRQQAEADAKDDETMQVIE
jgi:hypothetical protein